MAKIKVAAEKISQVAYTQWAYEHNHAIDSPKGFEVPIVRMLHFWEMYAVEHAKRFESQIGYDYVLGVEWQRMGESMRGLLNGETGRLDCGTLDGYILETMRENGFTKLEGGEDL